MKLNRLFLLAAMGLGLFACNDNYFYWQPWG